MLRRMGYYETTRAPSVSYHPEKAVELTLHVGEFLVVSEEEFPHELKYQLQEAYELRAAIAGFDDSDEMESDYLGRTIRSSDWASELDGERETRLVRCSCVLGWRRAAR